MSFLCQYSDSEGEEDDEDKKIVIEKKQEEEDDEDGNDSKLSISKVNDQPYGLIITEETTEINKSGQDGINNGNGDSGSGDKDGEMSYQIADTENDKMNNCHTIIHTRLENNEQEPKQVAEPDTPSSPVSPNLEFVSTPTCSKDPNFHNLYPTVNSTQTSPKQQHQQQQQQQHPTNTTTADNILKSKKTQNIDTSFIPDAPIGEVDSALVEKIIKYHKMKQNGVSINQSLRASQSFKNPSILEKLIAFCEIDEIGSNYPISQFNPHKFQPNEYYEELNKKQREVDEKREFDRINSARTKIDFVSESKPIESNTTNNNTNTDDLKAKQQPKKKYNKWEKEKYKQKQLQQQKSKATVISAAPTIIKKRDNPTTNVSNANSTTSTAANKSESLMKRFRTGGF